MNGSNDVAVSLGAYKDKTIAALVDALELHMNYRHLSNPLQRQKRIAEAESATSAALARARTDPSWQRYSTDNQEPLDLAE